VQLLWMAPTPTTPGDSANRHPGITAFFLSEKGAAQTIRAVRALTRLWFNPGRKESLYIVPGFMPWCSGSFPLCCRYRMVKEKEQGPQLQVYASGSAHRSCCWGKSLAYLLVG